MKEVEEYRSYAEDCRRIARTISNPDDKRRLLEMATVWALLAGEREAQLSGERHAARGG
jgi:hypothetical protein